MREWYFVAIFVRRFSAKWVNSCRYFGQGRFYVGAGEQLPPNLRLALLNIFVIAAIHRVTTHDTASGVIDTGNKSEISYRPKHDITEANGPNRKFKVT